MKKGKSRYLTRKRQRKVHMEREQDLITQSIIASNLSKDAVEAMMYQTLSGPVDGSKGDWSWES